MRPSRRRIMPPQDAAGQQEHRGEVDGDDVVPLLVLHAHEQVVVGDAGIVDEDVDLADVFAISRRASSRRPGA